MIKSSLSSRQLNNRGFSFNILKGDADNRTVGLLVCRNKDNTLAKHIINGIEFPVGISEYQLSNLIPEKCKSSLPTIDELEEIEHENK